MTSLERLFNEAVALDYEEPDSSAGVYAMADCMDDDVFKAVVMNPQAFVGHVELEIAASICYRLMVHFAHSYPDPDPYRERCWQIKTRAMCYGRRLAPFYTEPDWQWLIDRGWM